MACPEAGQLAEVADRVPAVERRLYRLHWFGIQEVPRSPALVIEHLLPRCGCDGIDRPLCARRIAEGSRASSRASTSGSTSNRPSVSQPFTPLQRLRTIHDITALKDNPRFAAV